ncbi:hypothetical protein O3S80_47880 [Streptomyces sp. Lzd4kr]|nr:hypothetical protein [Streptomyces sp. Lzd4kr]
MSDPVRDRVRGRKKKNKLKQLLAWWRASALLRFGKRMVDELFERCRAAGAAIRARVDPHVDAALAAVDVAAVVSTVRGKFARRHVLAEARRHLLETLRGQEFAPGPDDYLADRALSGHSRRSTIPAPGRRAPDAGQLFYTADFAEPDRWWIAGTDGKPPRESSRYERASVASLAVQSAIRAARIPPTAVQAHHQAAMPQEDLEGRTTDPATWMRTPQNLERLAAFTRTANARRRAIADRAKPKQPADVVKPADQQHHTNRPDPGRGAGRDR